MTRIATLTMNPSLDQNATIEHVVADRKLYCDSRSWQPGGGGVNVARLDTHDEPLRQAVQEGVFLLKPNLRELRHLTAQEPEGEAEHEAVLMDLVEQGRATYVVLSLGAAGAVFASAEGCHWLRAPIVTIRSRVGAGDSMVGGIVWSLANGRSPLEAARFGVAAGAAAVMTPGTELCQPEETERLYQQLKEEPK